MLGKIGVISARPGAGVVPWKGFDYNIQVQCDKIKPKDSDAVDGLYVVQEWTDIAFEGTEHSQQLQVNQKPIENFKRDKHGLIIHRFENQLGYADVEIDRCRIRLLVVSHKIFEDWEKIKKEPEGIKKEFDKIFAWYLQELYHKATHLPFSIEAKTHWPGKQGFASANLFWKAVFLASRHQDIEEALGFIAARPHSSLVRRRKWLKQHKVKRLSPSALVMALNKPGNTPVVEARPVFLEFPDTVPKQSFDNPENRFVRFVAQQWLDDMVRINSVFKQTAQNQLTQLRGTLNQALLTAPLSEAGDFTGIPPTSTVLAKAPGYRQIRRLWAEYQQVMAVFSKLDRAINLKQIDVIWEYWVLFNLLEALQHALGNEGEKWKVDITGDVKHDIVFEKGGISLHYNKQCKSKHGKQDKSEPWVYSGIPLRPDFRLDINGQRYVFDAKFRLDWNEIAPILQKNKDRQDNTAEEQGDITEEVEKLLEKELENQDQGKSTRQKHWEAVAKSADIVKMHAYRDAIHGVNAAFVIYPGKKNRLLPVHGKQQDQKDSCDLKTFIQRIWNGWPFQGVGFFGMKHDQPEQELVPEKIGVI